MAELDDVLIVLQRQMRRHRKTAEVPQLPWMSQQVMSLEKRGVEKRGVPPSSSNSQKILAMSSIRKWLIWLDGVLFRRNRHLRRDLLESNLVLHETPPIDPLSEAVRTSPGLSPPSYRLRCFDGAFYRRAYGCYHLQRRGFFAYFMLFRAWYVLSPPSSLRMEIGTWMALRFSIWGIIGTAQRYAMVCVVRVFLEYMDKVALKFSRAPDPARGRGGYAPMGADGWVCRLLRAVHQTLSLGPCTVSVNGAANHNRWGVVERRLPAKTQGRTVDCSFTL